MKWPWIVGGLVTLATTAYLLLRRPTKVTFSSTPRGGFPGPFALIGDSIGVGMAPYLIPDGLSNFAVVGYSTASMLSQANRVLTTPGRYGTVIVEGHLNDMEQDEQRTIANLRAIYQRARSMGARVVGITSTEWAGYAGYNPVRAFQRDLVDEWIVRGGDGLLDLAVDLRGVRAEHAPDRLHFTAVGYRDLAAAANRAIL